MHWLPFNECNGWKWGFLKIKLNLVSSLRVGTRIKHGSSWIWFMTGSSNFYKLSETRSCHPIQNWRNKDQLWDFKDSDTSFMLSTLERISVNANDCISPILATKADCGVLWGPQRFQTMPMATPHFSCHCSLAQKSFIIHHSNLKSTEVILVDCRTRWSLSLIFGFLLWSSSWRWRPPKGGCRLLWPILSQQMTVLDQFFLQNILCWYDVGPKKLAELSWVPKVPSISPDGVVF